jgi:hypothetical protein
VCSDEGPTTGSRVLGLPEAADMEIALLGITAFERMLAGESG